MHIVNYEQGYFPTNENLIKNFLNYIIPILKETDKPLRHWLDIGSGQGAYPSQIRQHELLKGVEITQLEIREECRPFLEPHGEVVIGDCFDYVPDKEIDVIISNPNFKLSERTLRYAHKIAPNAIIIILEKLEFLASQKRVKMYEEFPIDHLVVNSKRYSFHPEDPKKIPTWSSAHYIFGLGANYGVKSI